MFFLKSIHKGTEHLAAAYHLTMGWACSGTERNAGLPWKQSFGPVTLDPVTVASPVLPGAANVYPPDTRHATADTLAAQPASHTVSVSVSP